MVGGDADGLEETAGVHHVLFFMHVNTRRVHIAGVTPYPDEKWMNQSARNVTRVDVGFLSEGQYLIHDRDGKFYSRKAA